MAYANATTRARFNDLNLPESGLMNSILNGVPTSNVSGATFFVGYGPNGESMLTNGTTRGVVTVSGRSRTWRTGACFPARA